MTKEEFFEQAVNAFGDEKLDESIDYYKKALEIDPNCRTHLHVGNDFAGLEAKRQDA